MTEEEVKATLTTQLPARVRFSAQGGHTTVWCPTHQDISELLELVPAGSAKILPVLESRLVANTDNKMTELENYFGTNALGELPRCATHMTTEHRNLECITNVKKHHRTV